MAIYPIACKEMATRGGKDTITLINFVFLYIYRSNLAYPYAKLFLYI